MRPTIAKIITIALLSSVACDTSTDNLGGEGSPPPTTTPTSTTTSTTTTTAPPTTTTSTTITTATTTTLPPATTTLPPATTTTLPVGEGIRDAWETAVTNWEVVEVAYRNWVSLWEEANEKGYDDWGGGPIFGEAKTMLDDTLDAVEDTFEALEAAWESTSDAWNAVANMWEEEVGFSMAEVARSGALQARSAAKTRETAILALVTWRTALLAHSEVGRALFEAYDNVSSSDLRIAYAVGDAAIEAVSKIYDVKTAQRETAGNAAWESVGEASTQFARVAILAEETFEDPAWKDVTDAWEEVADAYVLVSVTDYSAVDATILIVGAIKKTKDAIIGL